MRERDRERDRVRERERERECRKTKRYRILVLSAEHLIFFLLSSFILSYQSPAVHYSFSSSSSSSLHTLQKPSPHQSTAGSVEVIRTCKDNITSGRKGKSIANSWDSVSHRASGILTNGSRGAAGERKEGRKEGVWRSYLQPMSRLVIVTYHVARFIIPGRKKHYS